MRETKFSKFIFAFTLPKNTKRLFNKQNYNYIIIKLLSVNQKKLPTVEVNGNNPILF